MTSTRILAGLLGGLSLLALSGCAFDPDLRGRAGGFSTAEAAGQATQARPAPDSRGVISYPNYQVAVARRGDTVSSLAGRVGLPAEELATYNGLKSGDSLREGEVVALPRRVDESGLGMAAAASEGEIDVASLAGGAIDRATGTATGTAAAAQPAQPFGQEPARHQVQRGETAYSIARLYNVSLRALAEWNGLGPDFAVREGQYLLIPPASGAAPEVASVTAPGVGSPTPEPPSASAPLPAEQTVPAAKAAEAVPPSPDLGADRSSKARLQMPVSGSIFREYAKGRNEGVDISASAGAPVVAAEAGTVATITQNTDNVQIVVIRHSGNLLTVYAGLDGLKVKKGDSVARGQQIGAVRAGNPPFLHFEVREGLESTDPVAWLK